MTAVSLEPHARKPLDSGCAKNDVAGYRGFLALAEAVGYPLEPFQRRIAKAAFGGERELVVLLPRGCAKSTLTALLAVHHLLSVEDARIYCVAASVPQARILFECAADFARRLAHPKIATATLNGLARTRMSRRCTAGICVSSVPKGQDCMACHLR